jgi:hypothetical protein
VAELALDQRQRDPLVQQLHGVRMPELVRGQAPAHPGVNRRAVQLKPGGAGRPRMAAGGSDDHATQRPDGEFRALVQPRLQRRPPPRIHADLAPSIVLSMPDQNRPAPLFEVGFEAEFLRMQKSIPTRDGRGADPRIAWVRSRSSTRGATPLLPTAVTWTVDEARRDLRVGGSDVGWLGFLFS